MDVDLLKFWCIEHRRFRELSWDLEFYAFFIEEFVNFTIFCHFYEFLKVNFYTFKKTALLKTAKRPKHWGFYEGIGHF